MNDVQCLAQFESLKAAWLVSGAIKSGTLTDSELGQRELDKKLCSVYLQFHLHFLGVLKFVRSTDESDERNFATSYVLKVLDLIEEGHAVSLKNLPAGSGVAALTRDATPEPYACTCGSCGKTVALSFQGDFHLVASGSAMGAKHNMCDKLGGTFAPAQAGGGATDGPDDDEEQDEVGEEIQRSEFILEALGEGGALPTCSAAATRATQALAQVRSQVRPISAAEVSDYIALVVAQYAAGADDAVTEAQRLMLGRRGAKLLGEQRGLGGSKERPGAKEGYDLLGERTRVYYDNESRWYPAVVVDFDDEQGTHRLHFDGFDEAADAWIDLQVGGVWGWGWGGVLR